MIVRRPFFLGLLLCLLNWAGLLQPAKSAETARPPVSFGIGAAPAWVMPAVPEPAPAGEMTSSGISYVLINRQENLQPRESFSHYARQITSENGVQNGAAISISFDPSYQKLTFHFIRVIRLGVSADRLVRSKIQLLQREREMESFLYDGSFTAQYQLEDVRVGDIIEYAFSIAGANPVLQGKYSDSFATEWSEPVRRVITRIVHPTGRDLHFLIRNRAITPAVSAKKGISEWRWEETNIRGRQIDPLTPKGYDPFGSVQVSEFADWQQVAQWAAPLYQPAAALSAELKEQIARLCAIENSEARIQAALRFVQDEIRYLGIESGVGSHQPTAPGEVLRRRFGDCKDKTLLLATLLGQSGIQATPALVNTVQRHAIAERLPSPGAFNHVILQVQSGAGTHWLDATRAYQRGPLSQLYVGNYGYALLLRPGTTALTEYSPPPGSLPKRSVVEKYQIPAPDKDAHLEVASEFRGVAAEVTRAYFLTTDKSEIEKAYLHYYARRFPQVQTDKPVQYEELPGGMGCRVTEFYLIPAIWQINDEKTRYKLALHPGDVDQEMGTPGAVRRTDPMALNHPVDLRQELQVAMFEDWPLTPGKEDVANAFFKFRHESKATGANIHLAYSYQSLVDQVSAADLPGYEAALRKIKANLGYTLSYSTPKQLAELNKKNPAVADDQFNWPIAVLLGLIVLGAVTAAILYFRASKLPARLPPSLTHPSLEGIGGWLLLVAFGLLFRPVGLIAIIARVAPTIFNLETWRRLTQAGSPSYHPFWGPTLLFEMTFNLLTFIFSILLLFLFFKKRAAWPRCFILYFLFLLAGLGLDEWLGAQIPAVASSEAGSLKVLFQTVFAAAIWIPYARTSQRVKATFRR